MLYSLVFLSPEDAIHYCFVNTEATLLSGEWRLRVSQVLILSALETTVSIVQPERHAETGLVSSSLFRDSAKRISNRMERTIKLIAIGCSLVVILLRVKLEWDFGDQRLYFLQGHH